MRVLSQTGGSAPLLKKMLAIDQGIAKGSANHHVKYIWRALVHAM
jgi:hypothetical protein